MNYLTDKRGENIDQWNPLPVNDVSSSYDKVAVTGETVAFVAGAAGFTQSVSIDKAPVMNLLGDRVGSFWRQPKNLRCSSNGRMGEAKVTALTETATSADVTITDPTNNLEELFETPTGSTLGFRIVVRDDTGAELSGYIQAVAATGNSYVLDVYDDSAENAQSWIGTLADFTLLANSTQFEIYSNETSIAWTTGTVLTAEVKFPEGAAHDPQALTQFLTGASDGEYGVDYEHGNIHYKKATTGASDTLAYTTRAGTFTATSASVMDLTKVGGVTVPILGTTTYTEATTTGQFVAAVRNDTLAALADTDNEAAPLQVDANGALYIDQATTLDATNDAVSTQPVEPSNINTSAAATSLVIKASAGTIYEVRGHNDKASAQFIQIHDASALPADTAVPEDSFLVAADSNFSINFPQGKSCAVGIVISNSSTLATKTIGAADCWFSAEFL